MNPFISPDDNFENERVGGNVIHSKIEKRDKKKKKRKKKKRKPPPLISDIQMFGSHMVEV